MDGDGSRAIGWVPMRLLALVVAVGAIAWLPGLAGAAGGITNLGPQDPVQSPRSYFPLGAFHRVKGNPFASKPTLVFLGTQVNNGSIGGMSALERWPVVKALDQFGSLTRVTAMNGVCVAGAAGQSCSPPTFDWSHAVYRSNFVAFDHKDLLNANRTVYQHMTSQEQALFHRFIHLSHPCSPEVDCIGEADTFNLLPLIAIGNYVQTGTRLLVIGDFQVPAPQSTSTPTTSLAMQTLSFDQMRAALVTNKEPWSDSTGVADINAEANIITALICRADGKQPSSVCGRSVIKAILKNVR